MIPPREVWQFDTQHIGQRVFVYDSLESTNDFAATLGNDERNFGCVVLAEHQTNGRGQHGRTWQSRPGDSILCSILLKAIPELARPAMLTAWVAVAVRDTVKELTGCDARIKWPNDVLVHEKKLCGILIEQSRAIVVGIGLNVNQSAEDFAELPEATSLRIVGEQLTIRSVLATLLARLDFWYARLLAHDLHAFEQAWIAGLGILHKHVRVECVNGEILLGRVREISFDALELDLGEGVFRAVVPEHISHIFRT